MSIAIVGVGVRGVVTLTRLAAQVQDRGDTDLDIHLIDPWPDGGGRTWRTDQSPLLLMNGPASTVTAYPGADPAGPTLLQWCQGIAAGQIAAELPESYRAEAARTRADSYTTRALYGWYLRWVLERTVAALPRGVRVHRHAAAVTDLIEQPDGALTLHLSDGSTVLVTAAALALGWLPRQVVDPPTRPDRWIPPQQPADQDLRAAAPGARVFLRGLGMNFFDTLVLLTEGRGGRFVDDGEGRLRYEPSGREPVLLAGSRRGVPFRTKPALPPSAGVCHDELNTVLADHPAGQPWNIADEVMPAIRRDAIRSYTEAQQRGGVAATPDLDIDALQDPAAGQTWADHGAWAAWLHAYLSADLADALTPGSPLRAAMRSIGETRAMLAPAIERDGLEPESVPALQSLMRLGASLAGGPPPIRTAQVLALLEAGILDILGPQPVLEHQGEELLVRSARVGAQAQRIDVLLDAHLDPPDAVIPADPLLRSLIESGLARAHRFGSVATGAVEVDLPSGRLVRADGTPDPRLFLLGIPSEGQRLFTILSPKPGTDSAVLREADAAAVGLLDAAATARVGGPVHRVRASAGLPS